jgi:hypothetical protein
MNTMARWVGRIFMWGGFLVCLFFLLYFVPKLVGMADDQGITLSSPAQFIINHIRLIFLFLFLVGITISALEFKYEIMLKAGLAIAALMLGFFFFTFISAYGNLMSVIP